MYTTQSATREANLYKTVYGLAAEIAESWSDRPANSRLRRMVQASGLDDHVGLVSTFAGANEIERLDH